MSDSLRPHGLYSLPGSSVHGISQARILEWVAISSLGDLPDPGIKPLSSASPALAGRFLIIDPSGSYYLSKPAGHQINIDYVPMKCQTLSLG